MSRFNPSRPDSRDRTGYMYGKPTRQSHKLQTRYPDHDSKSSYSIEHEDYAKPAIIQRPADIRQRVHDLFKNQQYTDVKFLINCGIKPKPYILAHRAILAAGSSVFADMLYGDQQSPEYTINASFRSFSNVVEYLYTDDFYFENDGMVMESLAIAKKFEVHSLVTRCESYFESTEVTEDIVCSKLELAISHKLESLKRRCTQLIEENTSVVLRSSDFKRSNSQVVAAICKLQTLNLASEVELFDAVIGWVEFQNTKCSKRDTFQPFLKHIRFLTLSCEEFSRLVQRSPDIFTAEEALNMVIYLSNPDPSKLPSWCNKGTNRCVNRAAPSRVTRMPLGENFRERSIPISLKQTPKGTISNLMCILEMQCIRGKHQINSLKFGFGQPVSPASVIGSIVITVSVDSKYSFQEHIKIENSTEVVVPFNHSLYVGKGNTLYIRAEANDIKNYKFLKFDDNHTFSDDSPFICTLGSIPNDEKLFFIKEVFYEPKVEKPAESTKSKASRQPRTYRKAGQSSSQVHMKFC